MSAASTCTTAISTISATTPCALPSIAAAPYVGVSRKTLSNWRALGEGPPYVRLGKSPGARIVYRVADLDRFLADRVIGGAS
jgi:hypothetical protein